MELLAPPMAPPKTPCQMASGFLSIPACTNPEANPVSAPLPELNPISAIAFLKAPPLTALKLGRAEPNNPLLLFVSSLMLPET